MTTRGAQIEGQERRGFCKETTTYWVPNVTIRISQETTSVRELTTGNKMTLGSNLDFDLSSLTIAT